MSTAASTDQGPRLRALLDQDRFTGKWVVDPARSTVVLATRAMWGLVPVRGTFREFSGTGIVARDGTVRCAVWVGAASITTNNTRRDEHLRSAAFLDARHHPGITFVADGVEVGDDAVRVTGTLTVRGESRQVSFGATVELVGEGQVRVDAEIKVNRADFGLTWNVLKMASLRSVLNVRAVFVRTNLFSI